MKKQLLLLAMILLPLVASAHDIEVQNADGVTIYYNYINDGKELAVTFRGSNSSDYSNEYQGNVVIPEEVTYMNRTRKVTSIGGEAFRGCSGLTSVTIGSGLTSIGENAFISCSGLKKVIVKDIAAWCGIKFDSFYSNPLYNAHHLYINNEEVLELIIPEDVKEIKNNAFSGGFYFTSVKLHSGIESIGDFAFQGCSSILKFEIPEGISKINEGVFSGCKSITSIIIPQSVTSVGRGAFENCSGIISISLPNSVTNIGELAFNGCESLISVNIPEKVASLEPGTFYGCKSLTSIIIPDGVKTIKSNSSTAGGFGVFMHCSSLKEVQLPNNLEFLGTNTFLGCTELLSIQIPNSVTTMESSVFYGCI